MSLLGLHTQERRPTTTEWDDIHRRLGNLPPLHAAAPEADAAVGAEEAGPLPLEERREDCADEDAELQQLRALRLRELKREALAHRYGTVELISAAEFVPQVNHAGEGVAVVVFLFKPRHYPSNYMLVLLERLAKQHPHVKFVKILFTDCIPNYPEKNLPTLLVYRDDDLLQQFVGVSCYGGSSYGIDDVEWELAQSGIIKTELDHNPHAVPHR
ncbi:hypothetical protein AB1Y20_013801 [Prymnesium parvum]|uniref:Phosducin domain-containing protein n=1 Tax=Prymnesium parvum TaxID=97485 RepID=A0AB34IHW4_PRYPA